MRTELRTFAVRTVPRRYSLKDLHRAAGAALAHRPGTWLQNKQTKELVAELEKDGIPCIAAKRRAGTYVCKELVYAYATWISAAGAPYWRADGG